ncbi:PAS domain-containing hybrid sensor histidine kinase/response regulator [Tropicimonas sediminicola]|uniref:histidine kinase n=1 Tax=Tropicimonas sediminicola TaxID=1031541 RepID=A0A239F4X8_9RHOB|nr:PAS domain-containing hybrid sensor histidine kinase/response regulator [Tropicimonas sediminicola]SNS51791.1 PAS/PAC sensor hybrid histidine kinase [Tropicimonas sediminicola]
MQGGIRTSILRGIRPVLVVVAALAFAGAIIMLSSEVSRKLRSLDVAHSDNVQWTLSQLEVEFLLFQMSLREARGGSETALLQMKRRFDVFYSRVATLQNGTAYQDLKDDYSFALSLVPVQRFLEDTIPLVDGPLDVLASELPALDSTVAELREDVRNLSLRALELFAITSDERRDAVSATLLKLAITLAALVSLLVLLSFGLWRMNKTAVQSGREQRLLAARLRAIIGTSLDAVIESDGKGVVKQFNGAAERVFGYTEKEAVGQSLVDLIIPDHYAAAHTAGMKRFLETGKQRVVGAGRVELEGKRKSGEVFPVELSIDMIESEEGISFVSFLRDITEDKRAQEELVAARDKALAGEKAKADFLAVMSHEMRTPLNGLLGTMSLLRETELTQRQSTYLDNMDASGHLLLHHVNDVLDISKFEAGRMEINSEVFDLAALLSDVVAGQSSVAAAHGNKLVEVWTSPKPGEVRGDPVRLRQVLLNLVNNALKFTHAGEVRLEAEVNGTGRRRVAEFRVIDDGIGISDADQARIFDDFETIDTSYGRKTGGTGLGLGIARRLARAMDGEIGVESIEGEGSLFWVRIPLEIASGPKTAASDPRKKAFEDKLSILIVEDNEINRSVLHGMLTQDGHAVTEAFDGREGVAVAGAEAFDVILMDISMPVMDGIAATRAIREGDGPNRGTPILAVTAHAMPADRETFRSAGMVGLVTKPIERDSLRHQLSLIEKRVGSATPAPAEHAGTSNGPADDALRDLVETLGAEKVTGLVGSFVQELDAGATLFGSETLDAEPLGDLVARAHKMAGSCGTFQAKSLHRALGDIETLAKSGDEAGARAAMRAFPHLWQAERPQFTRHLS